MTRIWAETGTRPRVVQQQQFEYAYVFGTVCTSAVETEAIIDTSNNTTILSNNVAKLVEFYGA
jgi:hypothetical protein